MKTMKSWMVLGSIVSILLFIGGRWARGYWAAGPEVVVVIAMVIVSVAWVVMGWLEENEVAE